MSLMCSTVKLLFIMQAECGSEHNILITGKEGKAGLFRQNLTLGVIPTLECRSSLTEVVKLKTAMHVYSCPAERRLSVG